MSTRYPSQKLKQVLLRIPEEMRGKLETAAQESGRSLTAEVLARLEMTFPEDEGWLSRVQKSPVIQMERRVIGMRVELDNVQERLAKLEARIESTKGESPTKRRGK